jgi:hypothetical protein
VSGGAVVGDPAAVAMVVVADEVEGSDGLVVDDVVTGGALVVEESYEEQLASTSAVSTMTRVVAYIAVDRTHIADCLRCVAGDVVDA